MIQATLLQSLYNKLYKELRKYIWDFKTVESLADFEIAVYQRFPDINDVEKAFFKLRRDVVNTPIYKDDEDLQGALDDFEKQLEDADQIYADLSTFREVVETNEDDDQEEPDDSEFGEDEFDTESEEELSDESEEPEE